MIKPKTMKNLFLLIAVLTTNHMKSFRQGREVEFDIIMKRID